MVALETVISVRDLPSSYASLRLELPKIEDFISDTPFLNKQKLTAYLFQGVPIELTFDISLVYDLFKKGTRIENIKSEEYISVECKNELEITNDEVIDPAILYTDGTWVWPGAVIYYVKEYNLELKEAFITHAIANSWMVNESTIDLRELDTSKFYQYVSVRSPSCRSDVS